MYKKVRSILSVMLAITVLLSSMSLIIESHYCGDNLIDSSVLGHAASCGMDMTPSQTHHDFSITKRCCHTKVSIVKKTDRTTLTDTVNFAPASYDLFYQTVKYLLTDPEEDTTLTCNSQDTPVPLLQRDYCALFGVLIC